MNRRFNMSQCVVLVSMLLVLSGAAFAQTGANAKVIQRNSLILGSVSSKHRGSIVSGRIGGPSSSVGFHWVEPGPVVGGVLLFSPGSSGHYGDTITISPSGNMTPNSSVTMRFFSGDTTGISVPFIVPCSTDSVGFFNCSFKVPALFFGSHGLTVTDSNNDQRSGSFLIQAGISLSPAIGPAGTRVTINGGGWALNDTIIIKLDNSLASQIGCPTTNGGFTCQFDVPGNAANGNHTFLAHGHVPSTDVTAIFKVAPGASLTLAPTSGQAGTTAQVSGAGLQPNATLSLEFNHTPISFGSICNANSTGSFANCSYTVPSLAAATYAVSVFDGTSNPTANFTINPSASVTVTPDPIGPGHLLNVSGANFGASRSLTVKLDTTTVNWNSGNGCSTDPTGSIPSGCDVALAKTLALGGHTISVSDGGSLAQDTFTAVTVISLSPNSGRGGDTITVTGNGFGANQVVTAVFGGAAINFVSPCTTDATNSFSCSLTVPATPAGQFTVQAADATHSANDIFTITPAISLFNPSTVVGSANTLNGDGFGANKNVTATVGGVSISFTNACTTDANGSFSCGFNVPAVSFGTGQQTVQATDAAGNSDSTNFAVVPLLSLSSYSGVVGSANTVSGTGFRANRGIRLTLGSINVDPPLCAADANGSFSCGFTVPSTTSGQHNVSTTDTLTDTVFTANPFSVTPSITLLNNAGISGSVNKLNGTGFGASKSVKATLAGAGISFNPSSCTTATTGSFSCAFNVPPAPGGQQTVQATDAASNSATAVFTVAGLLDHFTIANVGAQTVGAPFNIAITAQDAINNTVTSFTGTVDLTTTAGSISPTTSGNFTNGTLTQSVILTQAGASQTITATHTGGIETGSSNTFSVSNTYVWNGGSSADWTTSTNWTPNVVPSAVNDVSIPSAGVTNDPMLSTATTSVNNLTIDSDRTLTLSGQDLQINGTLTMNGGNINVDPSSTLIIGPAGNIARSSGQVLGALKKSINGAGSFTFPVGTTNGYSPVDVTVTAGSGDLTVQAVQAVQPALVGQANGSLQRYWKLTGSGVTANLTFNYLPGDVLGTEANYRVFRVVSGTPVIWPNSAPDTIHHKATASGVSSFSDWTLAIPQGPTAAPAIISGQVTTVEGKPLGGVTVSLSGGKTDRTITDSKGNYRFDNVETEAFYTITPALPNYSFGPGARSFSLLANNADVSFTATPVAEFDNPLNGADFFVRQQYLDFLGREPDRDGWLFWTDQIARCGNDEGCVRQRRIDVSAQFFVQQEFQQTGSFIYDMYESALGRRPLFPEYSADRQQVVGGAMLDAAKTTFAQSFVQRAEFTTKYQNAMTADSFVDALLQSVQSSGVDLSGDRANLIGTYKLDSPDADLVSSRAAVVRSIADNAAFKQANYNAAFVLTEYFGYLRRDPDHDGYDFWLNVLNNSDRDNYHGMVCSFITSTEYQRRFSLVVTRANGECSR